MEPELKAKWIEALRSGKYRQARTKLLDENGAMCCLGVLRDVMSPGCTEIRSSGEYLTTEMSAQAGLSFSTQDTLARMNDGTHDKEFKDRLDFPAIAAHIEANF